MKKKILVIDDDATIRFLLQNLLHDYEVIAKEDGYDALEWLNDGNIPDLVILDMEMPNINGKVLVQRIKFTPQFRKLPIIVISGSDSNTIKNTFIKLGADDYIVKPFRDIDFVEKVKNTLEKV
jgi:DNA-binding response OmpR family regulator